jgi:DNA uptake protein ComE-like DNA-binding protein
MDKTRINLANPQELLEVPGMNRAAGDAIVRHRAEHGPITDAKELARILGPAMVTPTLLAHVDFEPSETTSPEAPGA